MPQLYMVIDHTDLASTRILHICDNQRAQCYGRIYKAQGKKVAAPPLERRKLLSIDRVPMQYAVWNMLGQKPSDLYEENFEIMWAHVQKMQADTTDLRDLEREVARLYPEGYTAPQTGEKTAKPAKDPNAPPTEPRKEGATKLVWTTADDVLATMGGNLAAVDLKAFRTALVAACREKGINDGTMGVQYSKWKASKLAGQTGVNA